MFERTGPHPMAENDDILGRAAWWREAHCLGDRETNLRVSPGAMLAIRGDDRHVSGGHRGVRIQEPWVDRRSLDGNGRRQWIERAELGRRWVRRLRSPAGRWHGPQ